MLPSDVVRLTKPAALDRKYPSGSILWYPRTIGRNGWTMLSDSSTSSDY